MSSSASMTSSSSAGALREDDAGTNTGALALAALPERLRATLGGAAAREATVVAAGAEAERLPPPAAATPLAARLATAAGRATTVAGASEPAMPTASAVAERLMPDACPGAAASMFASEGTAAAPEDAAASSRSPASESAPLPSPSPSMLPVCWTDGVISAPPSSDVVELRSSSGAEGGSVAESEAGAAAAADDALAAACVEPLCAGATAGAGAAVAADWWPAGGPSKPGCGFGGGSADGTKPPCPTERALLPRLPACAKPFGPCAAAAPIAAASESILTGSCSGTPVAVVRYPNPPKFPKSQMEPPGAGATAVAAAGAASPAAFAAELELELEPARPPCGCCLERVLLAAPMVNIDDALLREIAPASGRLPWP